MGRHSGEQNRWRQANESGIDEAMCLAIFAQQANDHNTNCLHPYRSYIVHTCSTSVPSMIAMITYKHLSFVLQYLERRRLPA